MAEKVKVDSLPSSNSGNIAIFTGIGMLGVILGLVLAFMNPIGAGKSYIYMTMVNTLLSGVAMFYVYDSLKKGMVNLPAPCTSLSQWCSWLILVYSILNVITMFMALSLVESASSGSAMGTGIFGLLGILVGIVYFVLYIILGAKIMSNYEGKLKMVGTLMIVIPIVMIVGSLLGVGVSGLGNVSTLGKVMSIVGAALSAYLYFSVYTLVAAKK